ncbi:MAG: hypothetical protein QOE45_2573 [Frankiaceae bacterium]|nr:hypothetical protein [Frankiaceae bacterium]
MHAEAANLYGRWAHALDAGRPDLLLDDFTDDAVLWVSTRGSYRGHDEIREILRGRAGTVLHVITNVVVEAPGRTHAYLHVVDLASGAVVGRARYDDDLRQEGGRWRWHRKAVDFLWQAPGYAETNVALRRPDYGSQNPVGGLTR